MEGIQGHRHKADSKTWSTVKDGEMREMRGDVREDGRGGWVGTITIRKAKQIGSTGVAKPRSKPRFSGFSSHRYDEKGKREDISVIS